MTDNQGTMKLHILLEEQEKINLIGLLFPDKTEPAGLVWLSDHEEIAAVTSGGLVTGVKAGTAKITVKNADSTMADSVMVLVMGKEDTGLRLSILLKPAEKCRLVAMFGDTQGTAKWSSADDTVAAVDQQGRVTAVAVGTTLITVTSEDGGMTDRVYVTVRGYGPDDEVIEPEVPNGEVTEPNDAPMKLPETIPQKSHAKVWDIIRKTPVQDTTPTISTFGDLGAGVEKYSGGVLAPNGKIYAVPKRGGTFLELDPQTKEIVTFGVAAINNGQYFGCVLAPNGKIYGVPHCATSIVEISPENKSLRYIGNFEANQYLYSGGVVAPNGKIYMMPHDALNILEFDPNTDTITYIDVPISLNEKFKGGVLAPNGKIYAIPYGAKFLLEIDPETKSVTKFGESPTIYKFHGGALAPNGKIYCIPYHNMILEINPDNREVKQFEQSIKYQATGGALGANGHIYGVPYGPDFRAILDITPETGHSAYLEALPGEFPCSGCVLAPNGKIFAFPMNVSYITEIDPGWRYKDPSVCLSPYLNKY